MGSAYKDREVEEYWQQAFADCDCAPFPALPRSVKQPVPDGVIEHRFPRPQKQWLGITASTLIRAAWALVAGRITDSDDVVFGVTVSDRNALVVGLDEMTAPTIATVPVRVKLARNQTVSEYLETVQRQAREMIPFEQTGLERIAEIFPESSQACRFQTLLVIQMQENCSTWDLLGKWHDSSQRQWLHPYALMLGLQLGADIKVTARFDARAIELRTVRKLLERLEFVMGQLDGTAPEQMLTNIETATQWDIEEIWERNNTVPAPVERCVQEMIQEQAWALPSAPAVYAWDGELTYGMLDQLATRLAARLLHLGVGRDTLVPLCFEKSMWTTVAMLGVLKAGGAFVLLDPSLPEKRLQAIIQQVDASLALSSFSNQTLSSRLTQEVLIINSSFFADQDDPASQLVNCPSPTSVIYVTFTSGSTGKPKGVMITHGNITSAIYHQADILGFTPKSRVFDFASYSFDVSVNYALMTLATGGCLCVPSDQDRRNNVPGSIASLRANALVLTPSAAQFLSPEGMSELQSMTFVGEALCVTDVKRWWGKVRVLNRYGVSECAAASTINCSPSSPEEAIRMGKSVGLVTWVVDPGNHDCLLPSGCIGELLLEGPLVSRGYLNDPETTATAFIEDPAWLLRGAPGSLGRRGRLYKTGDLVKYNDDGSLTFVGRKDTQVKIRGQRVELGEVEHHIRDCMPEARQVVAEVILPWGENSSQTLVAFLQIDHEATRAEELQATAAQILTINVDVEDKLATHLPGYMVPTAFFSVRKLPMTATGKMNRRQLREIGALFSHEQLAEMRTAGRGSKRQPISDIEQCMQKIWSQVLSIKATKIGLDDSFFRLGGDSMAAMKLVRTAREQGFTLTVADVFDHPKLADLALVTCDASDTTVRVVAPFSLLVSEEAQEAICQLAIKQCGVERGQIEDIYPCTALQEGLMALTAKKEGAYVAEFVYELPVGVDLYRFRAAWEATVEANAILRTRIIQTESRGMFQIVVRSSIKWEAHKDLAAHAATGATSLMRLGGDLARFTIAEQQNERNSYVFILTLHHALYDGWSLPLVLGQVAIAYQGQKLQRQPFNSFISYLSTTDFSASDDFWRSEFADLSAAVFPVLPSATYVPAATTSIEHSIDVRRQAETGFTMSTAVRLAWAILLSRYTDSNDVVYGVTVAGRSAPVAGIELMTGPTIATVPLRIHLRSDAAVEEALRDIQHHSIAMIPFEQIGLQNIARLGADATSACQFQSLLVIQPESDAKAPDLFAELRKNSDYQEAPFDSYALTLQCNLSRNSIDVQATFDVQAISKAQMQRILLQFEHVLQQVIEQPKLKIGDVGAFSCNDLVQLRRWNHELPTRLDRCMHDLISQRSLEQPDAPAVCSWDGDFTYGELDQLSSRLAAHLSGLGVGPEVFVPLCFEKSKWTVVAILGVMKAGGAFVLLDPSHPVKRLQGICQDVRAKLAVCSAQSAVMGAALAAVVVTVGEGETAWRDTESDWTGSSVEPHNALYAVFTSGTTGKPKGVVIEHSAFCTSAKAHSEAFFLNTGSRVLQFASYAFDVSLADHLTTLFVGGCVCVPSDTERNGHIARAVERMQVNWAHLTPSVSRLLQPSDVPTLKTLVFGGEPVSRQNIAQWLEEVLLICCYGPAECSVVSNAQPVIKPSQDPQNIGYATGGVCWIVDRLSHNKLAPLGAVGELLIGGPIVGRGYLNDDEKTRGVFIESPPWLQHFQPGHQGRLYKTGDLVQYNSDGSIRFIGRKDTQVKLRGHRIELGEVEEQVRRLFQNVRDVVAEVVVPAGDGAVPVLAAFVWTEQHTDNEVRGGRDASSLGATTFDTPSEAFQCEALRVELRLHDQLPSYMVPAVFIPLKHVPLSSTGKTDRRLLRQQSSALSRSELAAFSTAKVEKRSPSTDEERTLQTLFALVLNLQTGSIGADDSFFRLGGDSIAAMKLVGTAREEGLTLTVANVFNHPKLSDLARVMHNDVVGSIPQIIRHLNDNREYLTETTTEQSFAQERLWFLDQLHPSLTWYLMPFAIRLRGPLRLDALNTALLAVENRHESLRTTFVARDGVNMQIVRPFQTKELNVVDILSGHKENVIHTLHRDQSTPFSLETEPGWRVSVYRLGKNDHILSIVMHHIISDGWSIDILRRELALFYSAAIRGQNPLSQIEPLPIQYRDYSVWQKQQYQADKYQRQLDYWVTQLKTSRPAELLSDKPRPTTLSGQASVQEIRIEGILYDDLQRFCKERDVTPFVVLLAAFRAAHYRLTGASDATIGIPNANRDRWELRDMIGFFVNLQCIRIKIENESFEELVGQVQSTTIASFANQDVPFDAIVSKLQKDRDLSRNPLVQVVFALHSQLDLGKFMFEGVQAELLDQTIASRFDLEFHFYQEQHALQGHVSFSTDLYEPITISSMLSVFYEVLQQGLSKPTAAIVSLPLLTDNDYSTLDKMGLIQIHTTGYPRELSVVDVFRQQVAANPDGIAIKDSSTQLTYAQLDQRSDVLAQWLVRRLLVAETLVGVLAARSCYTVVAFLGILKAGLAYLPLDAKTPVARMETILSSIPGHSLVLVGPNVQPPVFKLEEVEFVRIEHALDEQTQGSNEFEVRGACAAPSATSLAYVMFTSGSTGQPKGVMVEHRSILRLVKQSNIVQHLPAAATVAHIANIAFDASTWEIYATLLNGCTLTLFDSMAILDYKNLPTIFSQEQVQAIFITPALLKQYLLYCPTTISALNTLYVGGDRLDPQDMFAARRLTRAKIINGYGPTENTSFSTLYCLPEQEMCTNGVPIGRALSNSGAYVMDPQQCLVPLGVIGELVVTGDGLARGYINPQQNIDKFVSVMIGGEQVRAYRTGDYVRYRPVDGQLEFFGRIDGQVKIRGQRVELGEIEHVLRSHKSVDDAVTVIQFDDSQEARLVSFITVFADDTEPNTWLDSAEESKHVKVWEERFNSEIYIPIDSVQPQTIGRDFVGWTSMYDGSDIDKGDMNEWLDDTIKTILNGSAPRHVLEVGTGSGMILFNLVNGLQSYIGLEPSGRAVDFIIKVTKQIPALVDKVHMYKATAADLSRLDLTTSLNLVVINSVVQYFPSQDYLFKVVQDLLRLNSVETLVFGDIRSYALYRQFLASRALYIAGEGASKVEIQRIMADMERAELELLIDPAFFTALPSRLPDRVKHVEIIPKRMYATNELSCYRYTAVVHVKAQAQYQYHHPSHNIYTINQEEWIDFMKQGLDRQSLLQILQDPSSPRIVAVGNIPYTKTIFERLVVDSLDNEGGDILDDSNWLLSLYQSAQNYTSLTTTDLIEMARQAGYQVEISWARQYSQCGGLDAIFHHYQHTDNQDRVLFHFPSDHQGRPNHSLSNQPLRQQTRRKIQEELRKKLQAQLPLYMVPRVVNILDKMPVNANGKVDRSALMEKTQSRIAERRLVQQPTSEAEREMQRIWAEILKIEPTAIGLDDNFFKLGGNSIIAIRLIARARKAGIALAVIDVFRSPTLSAMASRQTLPSPKKLSITAPEPFSLIDGSLKDPIVESSRSFVELRQIVDIQPVTSFQAMFLEWYSRWPGQGLYYVFLDFGSYVDVEHLEKSCNNLVRHYSMLRSIFILSQGQYWQVVLRELILSLTVLDTTEDLTALCHEICLEDAKVGLQPSHPPVSFRLIRNESQGSRLIFRLTHAQYDGVCFSVIIRRLLDLYQGIHLQPETDFPVYLKYRHYRSANSATYWRDLLRGSSLTKVFPLLSSPSCIAAQSNIPRNVVVEQVLDLPQLPEGIFLPSVISAAWAVILSRITGEQDVVYGNVVHGRNSAIPGIEDMVGPCLNYVPVRVQIRSNLSSHELFWSIQQQQINLGEADSFGLDDIVKFSTDWPTGSEFHSAVQHQNFDEDFNFELSGNVIKVHMFEDPNLVLQSMLKIYSCPVERGVRLEIKATNHIISTSAANDLLVCLCDTIIDLLAKPQMPLPRGKLYINLKS